MNFNRFFRWILCMTSRKLFDRAPTKAVQEKKERMKHLNTLKYTRNVKLVYVL